jgi:O-antigen ligase
MALLIGLLAAGVATYFVPGRRARIASAAAVGLLVVTPVLLPMFGTWFNRDSSTQSITSLTGRTDFWPFAVELIKERPVIGWGVDVITTPKGDKFQKVLPGVSQAHNAYLEAALMGGIPGVLCWGLALLGLTIGAFYLPRDNPDRFLLITCTIVLELFAVTESSPAFFGDMFIVFVLAAAFYAQASTRVPVLEPVAVP